MGRPLLQNTHREKKLCGCKLPVVIPRRALDGHPFLTDRVSLTVHIDRQSNGSLSSLNNTMTGAGDDISIIDAGTGGHAIREGLERPRSQSLHD